MKNMRERKKPLCQNKFINRYLLTSQLLFLFLNSKLAIAVINNTQKNYYENIYKVPTSETEGNV